MSRLQELIQRLCPDGVEYKPLGEVGTFTRGNGLQKKDFTESGVGCIHYGQIYTYYGILAYETKSFVSSELSKKLLKVNPGDLVIACTSENVEDVGKAVAWLGKSEIVTGGHSVVFRHTLNPKYVAYFFQTQMFFSQKKRFAYGAKVIDIRTNDLARIVIPVPPLEVQEEIVKILDRFADYAAELQAELQARKQQYEYYRNLLLTFNPSACGFGTDDEQQMNVTAWGGDSYKIKWMSMDAVFEMRGGYTPSKSKSEFWENGTIPWFRMEDIRENGRILSDAIQHITPAAVKGKGLFEADSFILATTATIGEHALLIADSLANQQFTNLKVRKSLRGELLTKYVYYYMFVVDEFCKDNVNYAGFASVDMGKLKRMPFPIPPMEVQERIVEVLDRFETLVNDLNEGLPREIELRKQQYEHYRDRLLSFPDISRRDTKQRI